MKSTFNTYGTDRADLKNRHNTSIRLLEADFTSLFAKAMELASQKRIVLSSGVETTLYELYRNQPLFVCAEIISFDISPLYTLIQASNLCDEKELLKTKVLFFFHKIIDWRDRLRVDMLNNGVSFQLYSDIEEQIRTRWATAVLALDNSDQFDRYDRIADGDEIDVDPDYLFRLSYQLLSFIKKLKTRCDIYWEEIIGHGNIDPSLAMMITFLQNYSKIAQKFNQRMDDIPNLYYDKILRTKCRPAKNGSQWVSVVKVPGYSSFYLSAGTRYAIKGTGTTGKFLNDLCVGDVKLENISWLEMIKNSEHHPEADLGFVSNLTLIDIYPEHQQLETDLGLSLKSPILRLSGGYRQIELFFYLTPDSCEYLAKMVTDLADIQNINQKEAVSKILNEDTFRVNVSTAKGMVDCKHTKTEAGPEYEYLKVTVKLDNTFDPVVQIDDDPEMRIVISKTAWLYPYSWCRMIRLKKIRMCVRVTDMKNFQIYNDLGLVDVSQPFSPFGSNVEKGTWFAVGSIEMIEKRITSVGLNISWRGLPICGGGLAEHYRGYTEGEPGIDNMSFRVQGEYLSGYEWKAQGEEQYLFRTSESDIPVSDDPLIESCTFSISNLSQKGIDLNGRDFSLGMVPSGFYRFILKSPDMGFGVNQYRKIFAKTMILNSRLKTQVDLPQEPIQLSVGMVGLSYTAEAETEFVSGGTSEIEVRYIQPAYGFSQEGTSFHSPIPILNGVEEGGRLILAFSNTKGLAELSFYVDMHNLNAEVDEIPQVGWSYLRRNGWTQIQPSNVVADGTNGLLQSGYVSLLFPNRITEDLLDKDGKFWVSAVVEKNYDKCARVRSVFLNTVRVEVERDGEETAPIAGVLSLLPISPVVGYIKAEKKEDRNVRLKETIGHRNRALLRADYEQLILQNFADIDRVKCLPHIDTKYKDRRNIVTIVVMRKKRDDEEVPLCTDSELRKIEVFLANYISPFVDVDVINPEYEEVTVICGLKMDSRRVTGETMVKVKNKMHQCIAPWLTGSEAPTLNKPFTVMDLRGTVGSFQEISSVYGLKVIHVYRKGGSNIFERKTYEWVDTESEDFVVKPSKEWAVLLPTQESNMAPVDHEEEWKEMVGIGYFEVENTFVVEKPKCFNGIDTFDC